MKRLLIGGALAAGLMLSSPLAAQAGTGHHHKHAAKHSCATQCRPPKTPPSGGWPCRLDHSCGQKHHYKPCPPVKPPVTKPPVKHHHHRPPIVATPRPPVVKTPVPQRVTAASPQLPRTGGTSLPLAFAGGAFVLGGAALKRLARVR